MYLRNNQKSLDSIFTCLEIFRSMSGFTINYDKTTILRIGSIKSSNAMLFSQKQVAWTSDFTNVLGVWIHTDIEKAISKNYEELYIKAISTLQKWSSRNASLMAKCIIINSLIASLFVYRMSVLPRMKDTMQKSLEAEFDKFIWNGARPKVPQKVLNLSKERGGVKLVNLGWKDKSLKLTWVQTLQKEPKLKNIVYTILDNKLSDTIWSCNLWPEDVHYLTVNPFWSQVMEAWFELRKLKVGEDIKENVVLWYNSQIRIDGHPICWAMRKSLERKCEQWSMELELSFSLQDFEKYCKSIYCTTNIAKYRSFQYRLLHRAIVMNTHLKNWGLIDSNLCSFCSLERESYNHLFVMCQVVQPIWIDGKI